MIWTCLEEGQSDMQDTEVGGAEMKFQGGVRKDTKLVCVK